MRSPAKKQIIMYRYVNNTTQPKSWQPIYSYERKKIKQIIEIFLQINTHAASNNYNGYRVYGKCISWILCHTCIYRISHGLWLYMIFIQRVTCILSPSLGRGIEKTQQVDKNHIQPQTMGDSFYHMLQHHFYLYITLQ